MIVQVKYTPEMDLSYQALSWWFDLSEEESKILREKYCNQVWDVAFLRQVYTEQVLNNS